MEPAAADFFEDDKDLDFYDFEPLPTLPEDEVSPPPQGDPTFPGVGVRGESPWRVLPPPAPYPRPGPGAAGLTAPPAALERFSQEQDLWNVAGEDSGWAVTLRGWAPGCQWGGVVRGTSVFLAAGAQSGQTAELGGNPRTRGCFLLPENLPSPRSSPTPGARGPRVSVTWGLWPVTGPGAHRGRSPEPGQRSRCPPGRAVAPWLWLPMVPHGLRVGWGGRSPRLLRVRGRPQRLGGREVPVPPLPTVGAWTLRAPSRQGPVLQAPVPTAGGRHHTADAGRLPWTGLC